LLSKTEALKIQSDRKPDEKRSPQSDLRHAHAYQPDQPTARPQNCATTSPQNVAKKIDTCAEGADHLDASDGFSQEPIGGEGTFFRQLIDSTAMEKR
jgi:hypothetical protein